MAHHAQQMRLPTREGVAFLRKVFVLVVSCADALPAARHLVQHTFTNFALDAKCSHAGSRTMPEVVQSKVINTMLPNDVADAMR